MPRRPDPRSKTDQLILTARDEHERMLVKGMRHVFSREAIGKMQDEMFKEVERILARHHYPPGNPQVQMDRFGSELTLICMRCHKGGFKTLCRVEYGTGYIADACPECVKKDKSNRLIKRELGNI